MGQLFGQGLTQPGTALNFPGGQSAVGTPSQVKSGFLREGIADEQNQHPYLPGTPNPNPPTQSPSIGQPSFQQAATAGATPGGGNAASPGLTKAGKLATLLTSGLQGALAGRAKSEETVAATGGRRSGGAGMGFEAGYTLPWQRAGQQLGLQKEAAQVGLLKSQAEMVPTQYGPLPAALARYILPAQIRGEAEQGAATTRAGATTQAAQIGAQGRVAAAEVGQRFKAVPGVGLFDTNSRQVVPGTSQNVTITPEIAQDYQLPQEFVGKPMNVGQLASLERAQNQQTTTVQGAGGPALVNKRTGKTQELGLGAPAMGGIVPVAADPNNPGNITYAPKSQAVGQGLAAPGSAATQTAKATARAVAPGGKVGEEINAYNTAIQHADLLRASVAALRNGDEQTLNSLKNRFKTEFGSSGPITAQAIADAYQREVVGMLSKGHMTDAEIGSVGKTLNVGRQSPEQTLGVIDAYKALAQSKMNVRRQGVQAGMKGQPNFPGATADPLGIR